MIILGIDPGEKTGWAFYDTDCLAVVDMGQTEKGMKGFQPFMQNLKEPYDTLVVERFDLRPNVVLPNVIARNIIGWLDGAGYRSVKVMPAWHKGLVSDANIKQSGLMEGYKVGAGHARDALRLCLWFAMSKMKHVETIKLVKGIS